MGDGKHDKHAMIQPCAMMIMMMVAVVVVGGGCRFCLNVTSLKENEAAWKRVQSTAVVARATTGNTVSAGSVLCAAREHIKLGKTCVELLPYLLTCTQ